MPTARLDTDPFATLNAEQRAAVEHGIDGDPRPLLVIAGAGTGKTMTLAARVARLVLAGADPQRILLVTFSRRAAAEMQQRVGRLLHQALRLAPTQRAPLLPWAGTFHAVGARLLREYAGRVGLVDSFSVLDKGDAEDLMGLARHELRLSETANRFPLKGTCSAIYSRVVNMQARLADVLQASFPWCNAWEAELKRLFRAYVDAKQAQQVLDFDDLLLYWSQMLCDEALAREIGTRFDHVLVDEYQDTNRLQASILLALKPDGRGVTVVGDDAQAIYAFRGAEVRNILDFPACYAPTARVVTLEHNYRSTTPILDACNGVIALAAEGYAKRLRGSPAAAGKPRLVAVEDEAAQARWVADEVLRQREAGVVLKNQGVLFRSSTHSAAVELELARRNIPFLKYGGLRFLEAAHIKDVLSLLRWAGNPRHRSAGLRVVQLVPGIGSTSARRLLDAMQAAPDPVEALRGFRPPAGATAAWAELRTTLEALHGDGVAWPADLELATRWYLPHLHRLHDDAAPRQADLAQLARLAAGHGSRERFLTDLALDPPSATSDESGPPGRDEDYLILSTLHSAKGQEWSAVYLLNVVDGCMPSDMATGDAAQIEEERRLLYVGMTRARHSLSLLVPQRFYVNQQAVHGDRHVYGSITRFVPPSLQVLFDTVDALPACLDTQPAADALPSIDIGSRVRQLWA